MSKLILSGVAILLTLSLAPSIGGQTIRSPVEPEQQEVCRFSESLTVHVLFDNTTTVRDSVPRVWERLDAWLRSLERSLRPEDRIEMHRLAYTAATPRALAQADFPITARRGADRIPVLVEWMRGHEATRTDLADALEQFRIQRPRAQTCGEVLLLVTDGSLDPRDATQEPDDAIARLADAVGALREVGWSVFAIQVLDDDDDQGPPAFDNDFRRRVAESTRRMIEQKALSAKDMLRSTFGPSNVIPWKRHEKIAALLYERDESPFVRYRNVVWARPGLTLRDLTSSGVTNVLYAQTDDDGNGTYRGCSARDGRPDDHLVLGPAHSCYHLIAAPDDSLLEHLADVSMARFGWRAETDLRLEFSGRLVHPAQFHIITSGRNGTPCGAGDVPFENASAAGGEIVAVTIRFVRGSDTVWTDTMQALDQSNCFLLWNPNPVGADLAHRSEDTLYVRFEHYVGSRLKKRSHHYIVGRIIPLGWSGRRTAVLPFFALRLERWHVRAGVPLPSWARNAQMTLEDRRYELEPAVGSCASESHTLTCFRLDIPAYEGKLPKYGTIAFATDAEVDCDKSNASCIKFPVSNLIRDVLFTNDVTIDLILLGGAILWAGLVIRATRNARRMAQDSVKRLTRAFRIAGMTTVLLIAGLELVSWLRQTDHVIHELQVALGGSVLVLGLLLPVACDVIGDMLTATREWSATGSVAMIRTMGSATISSFIALGVLMISAGSLPIRFFGATAVVLLAHPIAMGVLFIAQYAQAAAPEQAQAPSTGRADPASSPVETVETTETTEMALSGETVGAPDEPRELVEAVSDETREDGAAPHSELDERFVSVHNATLGTGAAADAVDPGNLEDASPDGEMHTASLAGDEVSPPGSSASTTENDSERLNVQQVSLSEEGLPF